MFFFLSLPLTRYWHKSGYYSGGGVSKGNISAQKTPGALLASLPTYLLSSLEKSLIYCVPVFLQSLWLRKAIKA